MTSYEEQPDGTLVKQPDAPWSYYWLIESMDRYPVPKWVCLTPLSLEWTTQAYQALRFVTEDDARNFMRLHADFVVLAAPIEHGFAAKTTGEQ